MALDRETRLESLRSGLIERFRAIRDEVHEMQPHPVGFRERSDKEQDEIADRLNALPDELRPAIMGMLAERAGHTPGEEEPCELCDFTARAVMRRQNGRRLGRDQRLGQ